MTVYILDFLKRICNESGRPHLVRDN